MLLCSLAKKPVCIRNHCAALDQILLCLTAAVSSLAAQATLAALASLCCMTACCTCITLDSITSLPSMSADNVVQACFKTLMALLHTRHGSVRELSAVALRQMTANILGLADSTGAAATKAVPTSAQPKHIVAVRSQALKFVRDVARCSV